jgi:hypothetical protein
MTVLRGELGRGKPCGRPCTLQLNADRQARDELRELNYSCCFARRFL